MNSYRENSRRESETFPVDFLTFIIGQTKRQFGTRLKDPQKAVLLCKKENHALPEHACQTNHNIAWDNSKIITINRDTFVWKLGTSTSPTFL